MLLREGSGFLLVIWGLHPFGLRSRGEPGAGPVVEVWTRGKERARRSGSNRAGGKGTGQAGQRRTSNRAAGGARGGTWAWRSGRRSADANDLRSATGAAQAAVSSAERITCGARGRCRAREAGRQRVWGSCPLHLKGRGTEETL